MISLLLASLLTSQFGAAPSSIQTLAWTHPLTPKGKLDSPLVEVTPFVFKDRLYRLDNWQKQWETPGSPDNSQFTDDEVRIRDIQTDTIVSVPLIGYGLGMAIVHRDRVYVFAGDWGDEKKWQIKEIAMVSSDDLKTWTQPVVVLRAAPQENFFNVCVCRGDGRFVMLVESNDPAWPAFTFKYFESDNLTDWTQIPGALYGEEKYVGGPALYFEGGQYYTLYLESLGEGFYETRVTRSRDLVHWQDAPLGRPFVTYNPANSVHKLMPPETRETNASDAELCEWNGKTIVYYTGGNQHHAGDLQWAEFGGSPRQLLEHFYDEPDVQTPDPNQLRYHQNQLGCFVHFAPASFIGGDKYLDAPPASVFNPRELDAEQWVLAAKSIGARHIILTAKHHGGFCLWPTATTDYSVKSSPWKDGTGDVVREFVEAARKHGIAPGLYISSGDTNFGCTSTPEARGVRKQTGDIDTYFPAFIEQLTEICSNYGPLEAVWFDGAYNPFDQDVIGPDGTSVGRKYSDEIAATVRRLQPNAVIMGTSDSDLRWSGSEQGLAPYPLWYVLAEGEGPEHWLADHAAGWFVPEANVHTRKHWFWAPDSDSTLKTLDQMIDIYHTSIGRGANLLVNLTPDNRGLVPEAETKMLAEFGAEIARIYAKPIATVSGDGNWEEGHTLWLRFDTPTKIQAVVLEEDLAYGQRIEAYEIQGLVDGKWSTLAVGESIGRKRVERFSPTEVAALRLKITKTLPLPHVRAFQAFR